MRRELESLQDIGDRADELLLKAGAYDTFPTPIDDIIAAQNLRESHEGLLTDSAIALAPAYLRGKLKQLRAKAHALLDRREREIHINPEADRSGAGAFKRLHEVGHDLLEWQHVDDSDGFADDQYTLSANTKRLFEREANQTAAELLFQRDRLERRAREYVPSMGAVVELSETFGASIHATFRRFVETHHTAVAGVVLDSSPASHDPLAFRRREGVCSPKWLEQFEDPTSWPKQLSREPFAFVAAAAPSGSGMPVSEWRWPNRNNEIANLKVEVFSNTYSRFVLIWLPRRAPLKRRVRVTGVVR
jgi:hypothetical protein